MELDDFRSRIDRNNCQTPAGADMCQTNRPLAKFPRLMILSRTVILLPCHSLEDFPIHAVGNDADSLLANWTIAWHPQLIAMTGCLPEWRSAEHPPVDVTHALILVPTLASSQLPKKFLSRAATSNALLVQGESNRESIMERLTAAGVEIKPSVLTNDFYALGYASLQVQLMTRRLRGSSNLDEETLNKQVVDAAKFACEENIDETRSALGSCFDQLLQEKNSYYPVQPELIQLVLTAESTLGDPLAKQLSQQQPQSCLITGSSLRKAKDFYPDTWKYLESGVARHRLTIVSGLQDEIDHSRLSSESTVNQILAFTHTLRTLLKCDPSVFAQRTPGISSELPTVLEQFHFSGALHSRFTPCPFPYHSIGNIRWEANNGQSLLALSQEPRDANAGSAFLDLGVFIGERIDSAHLSTVLLAHWPNQVHFAMEDLRRIVKYVPLFGQFVTLEDFFDSIYDPGYGESYSAADYQHNDLNARIFHGEIDPISRWTRYWERLYRLNAVRGLLLMGLALTEQSRDPTDEQTPEKLIAQLETIAQLQSRIDLATHQGDATVDEAIEQTQRQLVDHIKDCCDSSDQTAVINPLCAARTVVVQTADLGVECLAHGSVRIAETLGNQSNWSVELRSLSACNLPSDTQPKALRAQPKLVDGMALQNEHFVIELDPERGGILSLHAHSRRNPLFSQRLSMRTPAETDDHGVPTTQSRYAEMVCDQINTIHNSRVIGEVTTEGRLVDGDRTVARFEQTVRVSRGHRIAELVVRLEPTIELPRAKGHYFCSRFARNESSTDLARGAPELRSIVDGQWIEAPLFLEFVDPKNQITLFPGGQNFHRRLDPRKLETLLIVAGESRREFRFGIGLNIPYALGAAIDWMTPPLVVEGIVMPPSLDSLFSFDRKNVIATWWLPLLDESQRWMGVQLRIRETQGRAGQLHINCRHALESAAQLNLLNEYLQDIPFDGHIATIEYQAFDYLTLQLNWNP